VVTIYEVDCQPGLRPSGLHFRWTPQRDHGVLHPTIDYPGVPVDRHSIVENHGVLQGVKIPVRPHFGVIALAPAETGLVDSVPPSCFGGNLDNWRIAKGAIYLRVAADGGLFSVGDPHASQGDSELCGTAIECSLTGVFQFILHKAADLRDEPFADIDYPWSRRLTSGCCTASPCQLPEGIRRPGAQPGLREVVLDPAMRDAFRKTRRFLMMRPGPDRGRGHLADVRGGRFPGDTGGGWELGRACGDPQVPVRGAPAPARRGPPDAQR
jgi:acetamidase/formamidase